MRLTDLFIRRPVVATVVNLLILLAGYRAMRSLNVRQNPKTDISVITVTTTYFGADADYAERAIMQSRSTEVVMRPSLSVM